MAKQHRLTYGLSRSPIRAARQNVPRGLCVSLYQHSITSCAAKAGPDHSPRFVPVQGCWEDTMQIRACADEEKHNKQQCLELEYAELQDGLVNQGFQWGFAQLDGPFRKIEVILETL